MLNKIRVKVNGKINLSLNIVGKRYGFHMLDSVVTSVSLCDYVTVRDRLDGKLNLIFNADFVPQNNTVIKAAEVLRRKFGGFGADIVVEKHLPLSGGMGGSSADAAGVIAAFNALFDLDKRGLDIKKACSEVGSDVFYMLSGGFAVMNGSGDELTPFECDSSFGLVYITTGETVTKDVYDRFDELGGDAMIDNAELVQMLKNGQRIQNFKLGNMLTRAACSLNKDIASNMDALRELGLRPNMTGSGSTVYALCDDCMGIVEKLRSKGIKADYTFTEHKGIEFV